MPFEFLQTIFSKQTYAKFKNQLHTFFHFVGAQYLI